MSGQSDRSEQVIDAYRNRKLASSALSRIREMVQGFERERLADRRMAQIGIVIILLILAIAAYLFFGGRDLIIS